MPPVLLDTASPVDPAAALAAGYSGVIRYQSDFPAKNLTAGEAARYLAQGLDVVDVWENGTGDALGGYGAGLAYGRRDASLSQTCGAPRGSVRYFAADFGVADSQMAAVEDYWAGCRDGVAPAGFVAGAYGGAKAILAAKAVGIHYLWQTEAWSGGVVVPGVVLLQRAAAPPPVAGVRVDLDVVENADYGGWRSRKVLPQYSSPFQIGSPIVAAYGYPGGCRLLTDDGHVFELPPGSAPHYPAPAETAAANWQAGRHGARIVPVDPANPAGPATITDTAGEVYSYGS